MYCGNCGGVIGENDEFCHQCGTPRMPNSAYQEVLASGAQTTTEYDSFSRRKYDASFLTVRDWTDLAEVPDTATKNKTVAGILAILVGSYGIHKFYMGDLKNGVMRLIISLTMIGFVVTCPLSIYEGIKYLTMDDRKFYWDYDVKDGLYNRERKSWG